MVPIYRWPFCGAMPGCNMVAAGATTLVAGNVGNIMESANSAAPSTVRASFWLWIASVVLAVISGIVVLATGTEPRADVGDDAQVAAAVAPVVLSVGLLIGAGLRVLFAVFMYRGRNWARIVLLIVAILTTLGSISTILVGNVLDILTLVATVVAAVLMFVPASNPYFRRR